MNKFKEILKNIKFKIINIRFFSSKNKIKLDKNSNNNNVVIKYSNSLVYAEENKNIEILSQEIKDFLSVMERDCKNFDPTILIKNFKKTLFDVSQIDDTKDIIRGNVSNDDKYKTIFFTIDGFNTTKHELFHLSTLAKGQCGFNINNYAKGLNEGYTQLLAERYFSEGIGKCYLFEVVLVKIIEQLIGQDNMEKYYFDLDLVSLINDLINYETEENIVNFIKNLDILLENDIFYITCPTLEQVEFFRDIMSNLCIFLLSCIENKVKLLLSANLIIEADDFIKDLVLPDNAEKLSTDNNIYKINMFDQNRISEIKVLLNSKKGDSVVQSIIEHKKRN